MADADYEYDIYNRCDTVCPDGAMGNFHYHCTKKRGHSGIHVAHEGSLSAPGRVGEAWSRWHDGDTVSVKAGQAVLGAVASLGSLRLNPPAMINPVLCHHHSPQVNRDLSYACTSVVDHSGDHYHEYSGRHWNQHGWTDLPLAPESTLQSSRRELAESLLKTMVEWDMRSCTVKQQREFLDAIRMLKKEARQ